MSEKKIKDLSEQFDMPARDIVKIAQSIGLPIKNVFSVLTEEQILQLQNKVQNKGSSVSNTDEPPTRRRRISKRTNSKSAKEIRKEKEEAKQELLQEEALKQAESLQRRTSCSSESRNNKENCYNRNSRDHRKRRTS